MSNAFDSTRVRHSQDDGDAEVDDGGGDRNVHLSLDYN